MKTLSACIFSCILLSAPLASDSAPRYQILFSPEDHLADRLIALIDQEKKSIHAAVYCLTHYPIANALIKAHNRGVKVEILVDPFSVKARSPLKKLATQGIPLFVWNPPASAQKSSQKKPLMHDKFCVFGGEKVWTGSFNFTVQATDYNRENAVLLDHPEAAAQYLKEFERIKKAGAVSYESYAPGEKG